MPALAVGVIAALLGLGTALRGTWSPATDRSLPGDDQAPPSTSNWLTTVVVAGWTVGEAFGLSFLRLLLVIFCYLAVTGLVEAERSFWLLAINTVNRLLDVLAGAIQLLQ